MILQCPLCSDSNVNEFHKEKDGFKRLFHRCSNCELIFLDPRLHLPQNEEKSRYENHKNDIRTEGYESFLKTLIDPVSKYITTSSSGLDFGCGPYPMMVEIFKELGFKCIGYDPYFKAEEPLLRDKYNYITCCEVAEHFNTPIKSFDLIDSLLRPNGVLGLKTTLYSNDQDFSSWYYIKDETHISLYSNKTMGWIAKNYNYDILEINKTVIIFKKLNNSQS